MMVSKKQLPDTVAFMCIEKQRKRAGIEKCRHGHSWGKEANLVYKCCKDVMLLLVHIVYVNVLALLLRASFNALFLLFFSLCRR